VCVCSVGQPLIMFTTLVVDTRDQNAMISDLVNDSDAIVVAPTAYVSVRGNA
jgi:hypothetical protein